MSLRALPLMAVVFILYNVIVFFTSADAKAVMATEVLPIPLVTGLIKLTWGDLLILLTMVMLFVELMKSTYTSTASLLDHGLSMLVFIACLVEFLLVPKAGTAVFFIMTFAALIDVIAGYTIGIRVARRDLNIGAES